MTLTTEDLDRLEKVAREAQATENAYVRIAAQSGDYDESATAWTKARTTLEEAVAYPPTALALISQAREAPTLREEVERLRAKGDRDVLEAYAKGLRDALPARASRRVDNDSDGNLDDVAIGPVKMFRLERMDHGSWWLALYHENGEEDVFWLTTKRNAKITANHTEWPSAARLASAGLHGVASRVEWKSE
ncbi:hypothetical protein [Ahrensia sp. R2A130]|uniref:hypothetical protein n=1 Tax=Ahrensia sp. R2A130 TaxID=744979 RepID=UPI0001E0BCD2|nr:hypothetical protein [Ahrensia sp. R2A130]EFL88346.1 mucin-associated surface protein [Ahrensia sp. R2A130]